MNNDVAAGVVAGDQRGRLMVACQHQQGLVIHMTFGVLGGHVQRIIQRAGVVIAYALGVPPQACGCFAGIFPAVKDFSIANAVPIVQNREYGDPWRVAADQCHFSEHRGMIGALPNLALEP